MSTDRDLNRIVRSWMDEGVTQLPDRVLDAVIDQVPATPQRRPSWLARRTPTMNKFVAVGLGAAAVVIVALIGVQLIGGTIPGGPGPSSSASATPAPTPVVNVDFTTHPGGGAELLPGSYVIDYPSPVEAIITVPNEPYGSQPTAWFKALFDWGPWHQSNDARLGFVIVENLYVDPCDASLALLDPAVGPTVDDLATALGSVPGIIVSSSSTATVDGYSGELVELTGGEPPADCIEDPLVVETTGGQPSFLLPTTGDRARVWILDVAGNRLVIWAIEDAGTSDPEAVRASLQSLVDSIQIEAP